MGLFWLNYFGLGSFVWVLVGLLVVFMVIDGFGLCICFRLLEVVAV